MVVQKVNKLDTGVRLSWAGSLKIKEGVPVVAECTEDRSQLMNRGRALTIAVGSATCVISSYCGAAG